MRVRAAHRPPPSIGGRCLSDALRHRDPCPVSLLVTIVRQWFFASGQKVIYLVIAVALASDIHGTVAEPLYSG